MKYTEKNQPLKLLLTNSTCYKGTGNMKPCGVLIHDTGAVNPNLKRYIQPTDDDPEREKWLEMLGRNQYNNDYNHQYRKMGVNAWIGMLADGNVTAIQTLPWDYRPWGCGSGKNGSCNSGWIQFEICMGRKTDKEYFEAAYREACEITAFLCQQFGFDPFGKVDFKGMKVPVILCHTDSHKLGLGSNHGDIYSYFGLFGKNMDTFRTDVAALMGKVEVAVPSEDTEKPSFPYLVRITDNHLNYRKGPGTVTNRLHLGSSNALAGRLICGRCGRSLKKYKRPDARLNDWRCRERASTLASNNGSRAGECGCRIALEREVKQTIMDAFNMLPAYREQIVVEMASIREGEIRRIDALIRASEEAERRMKEQLATIQEAGGDTALLEKQIAEEHARRDTLLLERAGHANKEVHLRFLLELITLLEPIIAPSFDGRIGDVGGGRVTVKQMDHEPGACTDEEEFFRLTRPLHPEGLIVDGRVMLYDNEMVIRYLDRVVVNDQNYEVQLKGGVIITI